MGILAIPITKAKKNMPVNTDELPEEIYAAALAEGLKVLLNKNMSKITGMKDMDAEELEKAQSAAWLKAEENLKNLLEGNLKKRKSAAKESREVTTESLRLAREAIKAAYREAGKKISGIKASVITAAAKELIEEDESFILKARENVAKMKQRDQIVIKPKEGSTLAALIAKAEVAKPKVAPPRKKKDATEGVVAAKAKGKGKATEAHAH